MVLTTLECKISKWWVLVLFNSERATYSNLLNPLLGNGKKKLKANTLNHKLDILYHLIHIENNVGKPIKLVGMTSEEASS